MIRVRWRPYDGSSHRVGERVLWFEWDLIRTADVVQEQFPDELAGCPS
jgi:hypothetical protein